MTTATIPLEFQDLADGPGELGPADDGKVPAWSWPDRRLIMIPLPSTAERQLIIRAGGGGGGGGGGVTDHADLTSLDYASSGHTGFEPAGTAAAAIADHVAEADPHEQYLLESAYTAAPPTIDSRADLLASTPANPVLAMATDTLEMLLWDGSAWYVAPLELIEQSNSVDMGLLPPMVVNDRAGYSADYITDKTIYNSAIGGNANADEGGIRTTDGELQVYLAGDWQTAVTGFRFREDDTGAYELEHRPIGFDWWIEVLSGNSDELGLNGLPLAQQYEVSMGAYPTYQQIVGREITA